MCMYKILKDIYGSEFHLSRQVVYKARFSAQTKHFKHAERNKRLKKCLQEPEIICH